MASAVYDLPRAITQIRRERPGVAILLETTTFEQLQALRRRRVDRRWCARLCSGGANAARPLRCGAVGHPLAQHPAPTLAMLHGEPFILYAHGAWQPFNELHRAVRASGIQPDYVQSLGSTLTILSLVNAGLGLALVPRGPARSASSRCAFANCRCRRASAPNCTAWRDDNDNPALEAARDAVRQAAGDIARGPPPL